LVIRAGVLLGLAALAQGQTVDPPIERYRDAVALQQLGSIRGRAFQERRRPSGADVPMAGTAIVVLPRSEAWLFRLEAIKHGARDSMNAYREAAVLVRQAREAYEQRLLEAGAGDLSHGSTADGDGAFTLEGLPAGPWVLLASRTTYVSKSTERPLPPGVAPPPPGRFQAPDKLAGYHVVTYWLREVSIVAGAVETVELTDRNAWLTGVDENLRPSRVPEQVRPPLRR
jgi:hypothetical protein